MPCVMNSEAYHITGPGACRFYLELRVVVSLKVYQSCDQGSSGRLVSMVDSDQLHL